MVKKTKVPETDDFDYEEALKYADEQPNKFAIFADTMRVLHSTQFSVSSIMYFFRVFTKYPKELIEYRYSSDYDRVLYREYLIDLARVMYAHIYTKYDRRMDIFDAFKTTLTYEVDVYDKDNSIYSPVSNVLFFDGNYLSNEILSTTNSGHLMCEELIDHISKLNNPVDFRLIEQYVDILYAGVKLLDSGEIDEPLYSSMPSSMGDGTVFEFIIDRLHKIKKYDGIISSIPRCIAKMYINEYHYNQSILLDKPCVGANDKNPCIDTIMDIINGFYTDNKDNEDKHKLGIMHGNAIVEDLIGTTAFNKLDARKCKSKKNKPITCVEKLHDMILDAMGPQSKYSVINDNLVERLSELYKTYDVTKTYFNNGDTLAKKIPIVGKNYEDEIYEAIGRNKYFKKIAKSDKLLFSRLCSKSRPNSDHKYLERTDIDRIIDRMYACFCDDAEDAESKRFCYDQQCINLGKENPDSEEPKHQRMFELLDAFEFASAEHPENTPEEIMELYIDQKLGTHFIKDPFGINGVYSIEDYKNKPALLVISQNPRDIYRSSSCQNWSSCIDVPKAGMHAGSISGYISWGSYVAYIVRNRWDTHWLARLLIHIGFKKKSDAHFLSPHGAFRDSPLLEEEIKEAPDLVPVIQVAYAADENYENILYEYVYTLIEKLHPNVSDVGSNWYTMFGGFSYWKDKDIDSNLYDKYRGRVPQKIKDN